MGKKTKYYDVNPKAFTSNELYGYVNLATRDWKDGLLSCTMRDMCALAKGFFKPTPSSQQLPLHI